MSEPGGLVSAASDRLIGLVEGFGAGCWEWGAGFGCAGGFGRQLTRCQGTGLPPGSPDGPRFAVGWGEHTVGELYACEWGEIPPPDQSAVQRGLDPCGCQRVDRDPIS